MDLGWDRDLAPDHLAAVRSAVPPCVGEEVNQQQPSPASAGDIRFLHDRQGVAGVPNLNQQAGIGELQGERDHLLVLVIGAGAVSRSLNGIGDQL
jgi:hypothetical protein